MREKTFPAFPAHAQPAILRIWQEAHAGVHVPVNTRYTHDKDKRAIQGAALIKVRRSKAHLTFIMGPFNNKQRPSRPHNGFEYN